MTKRYCLTMAALKHACSNNSYLALRYAHDNSVIGVNCKVMSIVKKPLPDNAETRFVSYRPIDFNEYISIKAPFIK
jgi:hypothetical protein